MSRLGGGHAMRGRKRWSGDLRTEIDYDKDNSLDRTGEPPEKGCCLAWLAVLSDAHRWHYLNLSRGSTIQGRNDEAGERQLRRKKKSGGCDCTIDRPMVTEMEQERRLTTRNDDDKNDDKDDDEEGLPISSSMIHM